MKSKEDKIVSDQWVSTSLGGGSLYLFIYESVLLIYDHFGEVKIPNVTSLCHTKGHLWP